MTPHRLVASCALATGVALLIGLALLEPPDDAAADSPVVVLHAAPTEPAGNAVLLAVGRPPVRLADPIPLVAEPTTPVRLAGIAARTGAGQPPPSTTRTLRLSGRTPAGAVPEGVAMHVEYPAHAHRRERLDASHGFVTDDGGTSRATFELPATGELVVPDLPFAHRPRIAFETADGARTELDRNRLIDSGGESTAEGWIPVPPRDLVVEVFTPGGLPDGLALVYLFGPWFDAPHGPAVRTDQFGRARFERLPLDRVHFRVITKAGVRHYRHDVDLEPGTTWQRVFLERGGPLTVRIVDRRGDPAGAYSVDAVSHGNLMDHERGRGFTSREAGVSTFHLDMIPPEPVTLVASTRGAREYSIEHHPLQGDATIVVDTRASLTVRWPTDHEVTQRPRAHLQLRTPDGHVSALGTWLREEELPTGQVRLDAVLAGDYVVAIPAPVDAQGRVHDVLVGEAFGLAEGEHRTIELRPAPVPPGG